MQLSLFHSICSLHNIGSAEAKQTQKWGPPTTRSLSLCFTSCRGLRWGGNSFLTLQLADSPGAALGLMGRR